MNLPKKHLQSQSGQIVILFLLILVLSLSVVLSVSSRVITDVRVTTTTDESNKAYFAAEAGVEEALRQLRTNPLGPLSADPVSLIFSDLKVSSDTTLETGADIDVFIFPVAVVKDETIQINLLENPSVSTPSNPASFTAPSELEIYWGDSAKALEVSLLSYSSGVYNMKKFVFDSGMSPKFCDHDSDGISITAGTYTLTDTVTSQQKTFQFKAKLHLINGVSGSYCGGSSLDLEGMASSDIPIALRLRPMASASIDPTPIAVKEVTGELASQGAVVESTGKTDGGVARKIKVIRLFPALPAMFDYVLFSGGDAGTGPVRK